MVLELRVDNQTIINFTNYEYSINLNEVNRAIIIISTNTTFQKALLGIGNKISIYEDGVLEFIGVINNISNFEGNGLKITSRGEEEEYIKNPVDISTMGANGVYKNIASASIYSEILNNGVAYSPGTIATGINLDFKVANSDSSFNALLNLHSKTGQEQEVNYSTKKINISNSLGSSQVDTLNLYTDFDFMEYSKSEPPAKKVFVYGKGDGVNQIIATATALGYTQGVDNTRVIRDPTIISTSEAQNRADIELSKLKQNVKTYRIPINNPFEEYVIGDTLIINAPTYDVENEEVRITRVVRGMQGSNQFLNIEVTNLEHSKAYKNANQLLSKKDYENRAKDTFMQGSGNTLTFGPAALNCKNGAPLRLIFNLPDNFIYDELDNIRIHNFTIDYDIDPFRSGVGNAELTADGDIDGTTVDDSPPVIGETSGETLLNTLSSQIAQTASLTASTEKIVGLIDSFDAGDYEMIFIEVTIVHNDVPEASDVIMKWRIQRGTSETLIIDYRADWADEPESEVIQVTYAIPLAATDSQQISLRVTCSHDLDIIAGISAVGIINDHSHAAGSLLDADDHGHTAGTPSTGIYLDASSFNSDFTIGDDVDDAASINSTSVDLYLDYWTGSAWTQKHSILATGKTKDTSVDISNGGAYPDTSGLWRVRIEPNSSSGDLVIGSINVKHNLDN